MEFPDGPITGLAFDWITANVYGVSASGVIFACKSLAGEPSSLSCVTLVDRQTRLNGIALSPNEGYDLPYNFSAIHWANIGDSRHILMYFSFTG